MSALQDTESKPVDMQRLALFLLEYASAQQGAGAQTLRVARSADRLAGSFDCSCRATFLSRHVIMTVADPCGKHVTMIGVVPPMGLNFSRLEALNRLSWTALDNKLNLEEVITRFHAIMARPRFRPGVVLLGASFAAAAFCRLFGGDIPAMSLVFFAALIALGFRQKLDKQQVAPCLSFMLAAFIAGLLVALGVRAGISRTPQIALGTSVLFLIPGVPMINSALDLLTGFPLMAFSRLVRSGMLVSCIGLGLGSTLYITGLDMGSVIPPPPVTHLCFDLALDGVFAAIASIGFAVLSNPGYFVMAAAGILAALGHSFRFYLLQAGGMGIIPASLLAALLIGTASAGLAKRFHIPGEFFSFPALLPMIPGMYAYNAILSTIRFMNVDTAAEAGVHLVAMTKDCLSVLFIMCAMALGAIAPLLAQHAWAGMRGK